MLLQLYPQDTTDFKWNGEPINGAYDDHVVRDDTFYLEFKMVLDEDERYKRVEKGMVVKALDADGIEQPFRVVDIENNLTHKKVTAVHVLYDLHAELIPAMNYDRAPFVSVISSFASHLKHTPFTFSTGISDKRTFNTSEDEQGQLFNALDVLLDGKHSLIGTWECEMLIHGFDIRFVPKVGKRTNALIYEKKNVSDFTESQTTRDLVTRIHAFAEYTPEREPTESNEEYTTPEPVKLQVVVDSPLINEYPIIYNRKYVNNDCKTVEELEKWAKRKFSTDRMDLPKRNIEVKTNIIDGTEINYGDYLILKYTKYDIDEEIRCVAYDYSPINETLYGITLGSTVKTVGEAIAGAVNDTTKNNLENEIQKKLEQVTHILMSANGFNRTAYGPDPVPRPIKGDLWFKFSFDNPNEIELRIWDGEQWAILVDDFTGKRVIEVIEEAERKMAEMDKVFEMIQTRVDKELAKFDTKLNEVIVDSLDDIRSEIDKLTETTNATVEILGGDGKTRYNKNRVDGLTDRTIPLGVDYTEVFHNGDGFEVGADYTISFRAECIKYASSDVLLKLVPELVAPVTVVFKPTNELYPTIEKTTNKALTTIYEVYHDVYGIDLTSDWYKSIHIERTIDSADDIELNVAFKEVAEGNLDNSWVGEWSSKPILILDGN